MVAWIVVRRLREHFIRCDTLRLDCWDFSTLSTDLLALSQVQKGWKLVSEKLSSIVPTKENAPIKHNIVTSGFRGGNSQMQGHMSRTIVHNIVLTNDQAGVIIGRGGSHINEVRVCHIWYT